MNPTVDPTMDPTPVPPLRLWPAALILVLQWGLRFVLPRVVVDSMPVAMMSGLAGALLLLLWWAFASRAPLVERLGVPLVLVLVALGTHATLHESMATGMMGMLLPIYALPVWSLLFVLWGFRHEASTPGARRVSLVLVTALAFGGWLLVRTDGVTGSGGAQFAWRWAPTAEDELLAGVAPLPREAADPVDAPAEGRVVRWPGFRGVQRDGVARGVRIDTDWTAAPPETLWRRPVGPGWSSFAVGAGRLYTQEQRGEEELVTCYALADGTPLWSHADRTRFWESMGGAGPRGTPTLADERLYAFGATGRLNALDATTGALLWSRDAGADAGIDVPTWGFSSSPLVHRELLLVAVEGRLLAYDRGTGEPRWMGPEGGGSYGSPQRYVREDSTQVLLASGDRLRAFEPASGSLLWQLELGGTPIVQPAVLPGGDLLVSEGESLGVRRVVVERGDDAWRAEGTWRSARLKPWYNDLVVHAGHAYGFDGSRLACLDLTGGERRWKGGRYGNGQLLLLADQGLLLVIGEQGELALVEARPEGFREVARAPGIEGKTWNHPVLVGGTLLLRNAERMAALRLALVDG